MKIAGTEYNLNHKVLEIYFSGCKAPHCEGCHNSELWDFNIGYDPFGSIFEYIIRKTQDEMIERVWILGGEPLDQDRESFSRWLQLLWSFTAKDIWIWTRYTEIPGVDITDYIHYMKMGPYDKTLPSYFDEDHGITLASSNQRIIKV